MARFPISAGGQAAKHLAGQVARACDRGLLSAIKRVQQVIVTKIIPAESPPPVDQAAYRAAWLGRPEKVRGGYYVKNAQPYAAVIEEGARAENIKVGRAMIEALAEWVARKGLARRPGDTPERVAWAIAIAMKRRGIFNRGSKGLRIAEKARAQAPVIAREEIERELRREMGR